MKFDSNREDYAPGQLQHALIEALESEWDGAAWWELLDVFFFGAAQQVWWDGANARKRANWVLGELRNCRDIVPTDICKSIGMIPCGCTYATLARALQKEMNAIDRDFSSSGSAALQ